MLSFHSRCTLALVAGLAVSANALASFAVAGGGSGATTAFPCVGMVGSRNATTGLDEFGCTGTVVGNGMFILTARHCLDGITDPQNAKFKLGNTTYSGFQIFRDPNADMALIKLGTMLPDSYPVSCPPTTNPNNTGVQFCGVGFGFSSNPGGTATSVWDGIYGTKRVFYNVIDGPDTGLYGEPTSQYSLTIPGGIPGEGLHGPGDSGGPMLQTINGVVTVIGVMSYGNGTAATFQPRPGVSAGGPQIDQWVKNNIPAPGAATLFATGILVLARRRRAA